jgi:anti-sigma regulatory factor (Ser/Thr protein kinase)
MTAVASSRTRPAFRHEALLYAGEREFVAATGEFVAKAVASDEPVMVMVEPRKIDLLRSALGRHADGVLFEDMTAVGRNPARIIPAWQAFVDEHGDRPARGVGEPVYPARGPAELAECQRHETLLNDAFAEAAGFTLLCPYDTATLDSQVIDAAHCSHPTVQVDGAARTSERWDLDGHAVGVLGGDLPEPWTTPRELHFDLAKLREVRTAVTRDAKRAGLGDDDVEKLLVAANEMATNSVCHGGGGGLMRTWRDRRTFVCEFRDDGLVTDPLVGRRIPDHRATGGRGLWLANQLCDLVQLRSSDAGTAVRLHMRLR